MRGHMVVLNEKTKTMPKTEKEKENKTNTRVCLLKFVHTEADATTTKWIGTVYNKAINIEFEEEARREEKKEKNDIREWAHWTMNGMKIKRKAQQHYIHNKNWNSSNKSNTHVRFAHSLAVCVRERARAQKNANGFIYFVLYRLPTILF